MLLVQQGEIFIKLYALLFQLALFCTEFELTLLTKFGLYPSVFVLRFRSLRVKCFVNRIRGNLGPAFLELKLSGQMLAFPLKRSIFDFLALLKICQGRCEAMLEIVIQQCYLFIARTLEKIKAAIFGCTFYVDAHLRYVTQQIGSLLAQLTKPIQNAFTCLAAAFALTTSAKLL